MLKKSPQNKILPLQINEYRKLFNIQNKQKVLNINVEKEQLYEENIHLKSKLNELLKENSLLKNDNQKKNSEILKKDKLIENFMVESKNILLNNPIPLISGSEDAKMLEKVKNYHFNNLVKKQYKQLKLEFEDKCQEMEYLKRNVKNTKLAELNVEIFTINQEFIRLKNKFNGICQENEINKNKIKEFSFIQDNFSNQQNILKNMQESINRLEYEKLILKKENEEIHEILIEKNAKIHKLQSDAKVNGQINQKLNKERKESEEIQKVKKDYERQINELKKELIISRDLIEKKNKLLKEIEKLRSFKKVEKNTFKIIKEETEENKNEFDLKNIKRFQQNPENIFNNIEAHLRNRLIIATNQNEKLKDENYKLQEKINKFESELRKYVTNHPLLNSNKSQYIDINNKYNEINDSLLYHQIYNINNQENSNENKICIEENFNKENLNNIEVNPKKNLMLNMGQMEGSALYNTIIILKNSELTLDEFSYILVKNFEGRNIDPNLLLKEILEIISSAQKNDENITDNISNKFNESIQRNRTLNEEDYEILKKFLDSTNPIQLINILKIKFTSLLSLKNEKDQTSLREFLLGLYEKNKSNLYDVIQHLVSIISSIRLYKDKKETKYTNKIKKFLFPYYQAMKENLKEIDREGNGLISFMSFRTVLDNLNINLKEKYVEFLIYLLKKFDDGSFNLEDLKYNEILDLLEKEHDGKIHTNSQLHILNNDLKNTKINENEESVISITDELFSEKIERIFSDIYNHLKCQNLTIREFLKENIFRPIFDNNSIEYEDEAIFLKVFISRLENIGIKLDSIDIHCLFSKLKILENYEALSLRIIENLVEQVINDEKLDTKVKFFNGKSQNELFNTKNNLSKIKDNSSDNLGKKGKDSDETDMINIVNMNEKSNENISKINNNKINLLNDETYKSNEKHDNLTIEKIQNETNNSHAMMNEKEKCNEFLTIIKKSGENNSNSIRNKQIGNINKNTNNENSIKSINSILTNSVFKEENNGNISKNSKDLLNSNGFEKENINKSDDLGFNKITVMDRIDCGGFVVNDFKENTIQQNFEVMEDNNKSKSNNQNDGLSIVTQN